MADQSGGEGWWQASDQRWYPPEQRAEPSSPAPPQPGGSEPPGPGYWEASDGNWYPPEAQAGAPTRSQTFGSGVLVLPAGTELSSLWKRFGNLILGTVLMIVTLVIGYVIWAFIVYGRGQTPAKQLLDMYVVDERTGLPASWGTMFVRGWVIDGFVGQVTFGLFGLVSALWIFSGDTHQRLTDKMVHTIVVDAPNGLPV